MFTAASLSATPVFGTIYYVSPTGSDSNNGTSPNSAWGSVDKVDNSNFAPGDQILFQYGSTWGASLDATSSGTASAPIVYGAYGNPSLGNPTFSGGNTISNSAFTLVSGTTYQTTVATPTNCVYLNNGIAAEAQDVFSQVYPNYPQTPELLLGACEALGASCFYYNSGNGQLFVNFHAALTNQTIDLGTRQDAIYSYFQSNLVFRNLSTTETAADQAGYGVRIEDSSNVTLENCTVTNAGKHSVGVIDSTGVTVTNVVANGTQPWLGYGGASAFVSYGSIITGPTSVNGTSVYTNDSYTNPNGEYAIFISHGGANGIASVALNNMVANNNDQTGISIQTTAPNELATISGGIFTGGTEIDTNNAIVNGATFNGTGGSIFLTGSHSVVQNSTFNGYYSSFAGGSNGALQDTGSDNTFRFNVVGTSDSSGPGITPTSSSATTHIVGNIVLDLSDPSHSIGIGLLGSSGSFNSNYNLYPLNTSFELYSLSNVDTAAQWQSLGYDINSLFSTIAFNNSSSGDFSLQSGSAGLGLVPASAIDPTLTTANSLLGSPNSNGNYNAGLNPYVPTRLSLVTGNVTVNNASMMAVVAPAANLLAISNTGTFIVLSTASVDLACNVSNRGAFVSTGSLISTGNFNNSGSAFFSGSQVWSPGTTFTNLAGNVVFATDAGGTIAPVGYLTINASGGSVVFASSQHLAGLNILLGATAQVALQPMGSPSIVFTPSLSVTGTLDLTDNDMVVQSGNRAAVTALVRQGYNKGKWNGTGISSSTAAADTTHLTALGMILNTAGGVDALYGDNGVSLATLGLFDGSIPNSTDVLVKYTYYGDANLDGKVDGTDYSLIDNGFLNELAGWYNGDFNYDGIVNGSDYTLIDNAFNQQGASLATSVTDPSALSTQLFASNSSAVPEPASLAITSFFSFSLLRRRRRGLMEELQSGLPNSGHTTLNGCVTHSAGHRR